MARSIQFSRLSGPALVAACVACVVLLVDAILHVSFGLLPTVLARAEYLSHDRVVELGRRVTAVAKERRQLPFRPPLAIVVGFSTAREGLVRAILDEQCEHRWQWLNLASSGGSYYEFAYEYRPLFIGNLDADLIVLAAHPAWLAGRRIQVDGSYSSPITVARLFYYRLPGQAWYALSKWSWLYFHRNRLSLEFRAGLSRVHEDMFQWLGLPLESLFPPIADPWTEERHYNGHAEEGALRRQREGWTRYGWFEQSSFRPDTDEAKALDYVLRTLKAKAKHFVVVLLPESSYLRDRVPPEAERLFSQVVAARTDAPPVIDLRNSLPDTFFYDFAHPNENGRPVVSALLIAHLRKLGWLPGPSRSPQRPQP